MYFLFLLTISLLMIFCGKVTGMGCTMFPGCEPKCFQSTFDLTIKKNGCVCENGNSVLAQNSWINQSAKVAMEGTVTVPGAIEDSKNFPLKHDINYFCEKDTGTLYTDTKYGTKFKYSIEGEDPRSFFITTRRELWICSSSKNKSSFYRVVTEHLSKQTIRRIEYPQGTLALNIPIPRVTADDPLMFTTAIKEIKYVNPQTDEELQYIGFLTFKPLDRKKSYYKDFEELSMSTDVESGTVKVSVSQQQKSVKTIFKQQPLNDIGIPESFESPKMLARCESIVRRSDSRLFGVLPMWSHAQESLGAEGKQLGPWTEITPSAFLDYFVVTKYDMMLCEVDKTHETFYRVKIHYLGTTNIDEAYLNKKKIVYSFQLPYTTDRSIAIRENINFMIKKKNKKQFFNFRGKMRPKFEIKGFLGVFPYIAVRDDGDDDEPKP